MILMCIHTTTGTAQPEVAFINTSTLLSLHHIINTFIIHSKHRLLIREMKTKAKKNNENKEKSVFQKKLTKHINTNNRSKISETFLLSQTYL